MYNWATLTFFKPSSAKDDTYQHEITYTDVPAVIMHSDSLDDHKQKPLLGGRSKRRLVGTDGDSVIVSAAKRVKKAVTQAVQRNKLKGYKQCLYSNMACILLQLHTCTLHYTTHTHTTHTHTHYTTLHRRTILHTRIILHYTHTHTHTHTHYAIHKPTYYQQLTNSCVLFLD